MSNDPVINALAVQMEYGNDELQRDIEKRIQEIALWTIEKYMQENSSQIMQRMIVNNAYDFNSQVLRAVKDHFNNPRTIY